MGYIEIEGGRPLSGQVRVQGSKNAALPVLAATILNPGRTVLHHCPRIRDVEAMLDILENLGCKTGWEEDTLWVDAGSLASFTILRNHAERMRSSITLLGSLLGRMRQACIPYPGGCVIGERPINLHLDGLKKMGAEFWESEGQVQARCRELKGDRLVLRFPSVGATENLLLAAVLAKGTTWIIGAAREPEILELCRFLVSMGAKIEGAGSSCIRITGVKRLHDTEYTIVSDRIVAGTYLCAAAACGGEAALSQAPVSQLRGMFPVLWKMGARLYMEGDALVIRAPERCRGVRHIETAPYPGFPTDLQSPLLAALCRARGISTLRENIFEARFKIVEELRSMGAYIRVEGNTAVVEGREHLQGGILTARELRGGAALCIAAACARGSSRVYGCEYIMRGYENVIGDLKNLGVVVRYIPDGIPTECIRDK